MTDVLLEAVGTAALVGAFVALAAGALERAQGHRRARAARRCECGARLDPEGARWDLLAGCSLIRCERCSLSRRSW